MTPTNPSHKDSVAVPIPPEVVVVEEEEEQGAVPLKRRWSSEGFSALRSLCANFTNTEDTKRLVHGIKVGLALVLVSLLYILEVMHDKLGDNAMWAIMTVVVIFEVYPGATISKGVNRGIGTILGGGLGFLVALLAQEIGGSGKALVIGTSVFIFSSAATYLRLIPCIKRRHDYGAMIFILTFSLVSISGVRIDDKIVKLASERLSSVFIGFAICVITNLLIHPVWAGDELHASLVSKFENLAISIEGFMVEYFECSERKTKLRTNGKPSSCFSVLYSKSTDETLANFAKWEPWHGKFGFYYPWNRYLRMAELLRELAVSIISLKRCMQTLPQCFRPTIKEQCESTMVLLGCTLDELGRSIHDMRHCHVQESVVEKLQAARLELNSPMTALNQNDMMRNGPSFIGFEVILVGILDKVEELDKEVRELATLANFHHQ